MAKVDPSLIYILNKTTNKYVGTSILTTADKVLYDLDSSTTLKDKIMQMETKITNNLESNLKPYGGNKMNFLRDYNGDGNVYINQNNTLNKVTKYHLMDGKNNYSDLKIKNLEADNHMNITELKSKFYSKEEVDEKDRAIVEGEVKKSESAKKLKSFDNDKDYMYAVQTENSAMAFNISGYGRFINLMGLQSLTITSLAMGLYCKDINKVMEFKEPGENDNFPTYILGAQTEKNSLKLYPSTKVTVKLASTANYAEEAANADNAKKYKGQDIDDVISKVRSLDISAVARVKVGTDSPTIATIANGEIYLQLY